MAVAACFTSSFSAAVAGSSAVIVFPVSTDGFVAIAVRSPHRLMDPVVRRSSGVNGVEGVGTVVRRLSGTDGVEGVGAIVSSLPRLGSWLVAVDPCSMIPPKLELVRLQRLPLVHRPFWQVLQISSA